MEETESSDSNCTFNLRVEQRNTTTDYMYGFAISSTSQLAGWHFIICCRLVVTILSYHCLGVKPSYVLFLSPNQQGSGDIAISLASVHLSISRQKLVHLITVISFEIFWIIFSRHVYQVKAMCRMQEWLLAFWVISLE